jgi:hypothetical protein
MAARTLRHTTLGGIPISIDPLTKDYIGYRYEMLDAVPVITPEWTDINPADAGVTLIESLALQLDKLSYLLDRVQNESYKATVQERKSAIDLLRLIGYEFVQGVAASVTVEVVTNLGSVVLPAGWAVRSTPTENTPALLFELTAPVTLIGAGTHEVILVHGESVLNEPLGTSNGEPNQVFNLARIPLAFLSDGSDPVTVEVNSVQWSLVDSFIGAEFDDEFYKLRVNADGVASIVFSDGTNGEVPALGNSIVATAYRVGGGTIGNSVGTGTLTTQINPVAGVVSVTNPERPSGGLDPQTVGEAKRDSTLAVRANDRAVTLEDFEAKAKETTGGGIRSARAVHPPSSGLKVDIYITAEGVNPVPTGEWFTELEAGSGLIGAVGRYLLTKKVAPTVIEVLPPIVVKPYLKADIYLLPRRHINNVRKNVIDNLVNYYTNDVMDDFGIGVPESKMDQIIEGTDGVDYLNIFAFHRVPQPKLLKGSKAAIDAATFTVDNAQETMRYERYTVRWLNPTVYRLIGDLYGPVVDTNGAIRTFSAGTTYSISHFPEAGVDTVAEELPQFDINILAPTPPVASDEWGFSSDNYRGNIAIDEHELIVATILNDNTLSSDEFDLTFNGGIG